MTPFKSVYGQEPMSIVRYEQNSQDPFALQDLLKERDTVIDELKLNLTKAQGFMKRFANRKQQTLEFQVGTQQ